MGGIGGSGSKKVQDLLEVIDDSINSIGTTITDSIVPLRVDTPGIFEDNSFVSGDSPTILDVNTKLGRNATEFIVINGGAGSFTVSISNDGSFFGDEHTMKSGETYAIDNISVDSIRITHVADSAFRVVVI